MRYCDGITHEDGYLVGTWPKEIKITRDIVETPPKHVGVGKRGVLTFTFKNGSAQYNRIEDTPDGWKYRCVYSDGVPMKDEKAFDVV